MEEQVEAIVVVLLDALRYDFLGCYGRDPSPSPNIDRIAEESIVFLKAYSPGPCTPVSLPRMFSLIPNHPPVGPKDSVGEHYRRYKWRTIRQSIFGKVMPVSLIIQAARIKKRLESLEKRERTKFVFLRRSYICKIQEKFFTAAVGANLFLDFGFDQGFDEFYELCYEKAKRGEDIAKGVSAQEVYRVAKDLINNLPSPLFLYVHFLQPHEPYFCNDQCILSHHKLIEVMVRYYSGRISKEKFSKILVKLYSSNIRHVDRYVGKLFKYVERQFSNFIFVITSDHGEEFGEEGYFFHEMFRFVERLLHVPLIVFGCGRRTIITKRFNTIRLFPYLVRLSEAFQEDTTC